MNKIKKLIIIKADVNDADYITSQNEITDKQIEQLKPLIKAISEFESNEDYDNNWEDPNEMYIESGKCDEETFNYFHSILPWMDNEDIHTIESITILEVVNEIELL